MKFSELNEVNLKDDYTRTSSIIKIAQRISEKSNAWMNDIIEQLEKMPNDKLMEFRSDVAKLTQMIRENRNNEIKLKSYAKQLVIKLKKDKK